MSTAAAVASTRTPFRKKVAGKLIPATDLFASGVYRGKEYTVDDLDEMAANFKELGPAGSHLLNPPCVLGHENHADSQQPYKKRTDQPAVAWVNHVWVEKYHDPDSGREEGILRGRLVGVDHKAAADIKAGKYRKVSAEVYDDFEDDHGTRHGKALRRVAFLGAEVPQVKRIGDLADPVDHFCERPRTKLKPKAAFPTTRGTFLCFAETAPMQRAEMIAAITAAMPGVMPATLDAMSDDMLADLVKNLPQPAAAAPVVPAAAPVATFADPAEMTREELLAALTAAGQDAAGLEGLTDDELKELFVELGLDDESEPAEGQMAEGDPAAPPAEPAMTRDELIAELTALGADPATLTGLTDDELKAMYAEMVGGTAAPAGAGGAVPMGEKKKAGVSAGYLSYAERVLKTSVAKTLRRDADTKRRTVDKFCEQLVKDGRILPVQADDYRAMLMKCDDNRAVVKFSEGGRTRHGTALEAKMSELEGRAPVVRFGERVPGSAAPAGDLKTRREQETAAEAQKVEQFCTKFSETFEATSTDPQELVERFKKLREKNPKLTAAEYLGTTV